MLVPNATKVGVRPDQSLDDNVVLSQRSYCQLILLQLFPVVATISLAQGWRDGVIG